MNHKLFIAVGLLVNICASNASVAANVSTVADTGMDADQRKAQPPKLVVSASPATIPSAGSSAAVGVDEGIRDFLGRRYQLAVVKLARASGVEPGNSTIHYYLARALLQMSDKDQAFQEFRIAYAVDPQGPMSRYCKEAFSLYHLPVPDSTESQVLRATVCGAHGSGGHVPFGETSTGLQPESRSKSELTNVGKPPKLARALSVIRRQVDYEKKKDLSFSQITSEDILSKARADVADVKARAELEVSHLYMPQVNIRDPRMMQASYLEMKEEQIRTAAKEHEERILREAQERAESCRKVGDLRQTSLDQVADNLEKQMSDSGRSSGVHLIPDGTDLYVRRYASAPTDHPKPEAHSAVLRIYGKPTAGKVDPACAEAQVGDRKSLTVTRATVRGKVLKTSVPSKDAL